MRAPAINSPIENARLCMSLMRADTEAEVLETLRKAGYWDDTVAWISIELVRRVRPTCPQRYGRSGKRSFAQRPEQATVPGEAIGVSGHVHPPASCERV
jgi:hypothetical protein